MKIKKTFFKIILILFVLFWSPILFFIMENKYNVILAVPHAFIISFMALGSTIAIKGFIDNRIFVTNEKRIKLLNDIRKNIWSIITVAFFYGIIGGLATQVLYFFNFSSIVDIGKEQFLILIPFSITFLLFLRLTKNIKNKIEFIYNPIFDLIIISLILVIVGESVSLSMGKELLPTGVSIDDLLIYSLIYGLYFSLIDFLLYVYRKSVRKYYSKYFKNFVEETIKF